MCLTWTYTRLGRFVQSHLVQMEPKSCVVSWSWSKSLESVQSHGNCDLSQKIEVNSQARHIANESHFIYWETLDEGLFTACVDGHFVIQVGAQGVRVDRNPCILAQMLAPNLFYCTLLRPKRTTIQVNGPCMKPNLPWPWIFPRASSESRGC